MVATPELASAKAALTSSLRRHDPNPLTKRDVEEFIQLLDNTLDECSRPNVQVCLIAREQRPLSLPVVRQIC
jgi:hypothetical protein